MSTKRGPIAADTATGPDIEERSPKPTETSPSPRSVALTGPDCNETALQGAQNAPASIDPLAVYTIREAAKLLRVSVRKVRDLEADGRMRRCPHTRNMTFLGEELLRAARGGTS